MKKLHSIDSFGIKKVSLSNIRVERLEDRIKPTVAFPHRHDFFQIMIVLGGSGEHQIDFKRHKLSAHQIFLMKPGQMHSWNLNQKARGYIVEFNRVSLNLIKDSARLMNDLTLSPDALILEKKIFEEIVKVTEVMIEEFQKTNEMQDLCLQGYLVAFIIQLIRTYRPELKHHKALSIIEEFKELVEENFRLAHDVEFYAKALKLKSQVLTMKLSRALGKPPRQMIQERLLLEAKRYLAFSDLGIAEIGHELGFDDPNYFTRFFRQHEKMTPAEFRKENSRAFNPL